MGAPRIRRPLTLRPAPATYAPKMGGAATTGGAAAPTPAAAPVPSYYRGEFNGYGGAYDGQGYKNGGKVAKKKPASKAAAKKKR